MTGDTVDLGAGCGGGCAAGAGAGAPGILGMGAAVGVKSRPAASAIVSINPKRLYFIALPNCKLPYGATRQEDTNLTERAR